MNLNLWVVVLLGTQVQQSVSQVVQCFSEFSLPNGICNDLLGEVKQDECCMNPNYGYIAADGVCKSCRRAAWTEWSSWGKCSVPCTEGVRQRHRMCYGIGSCSDPEKLGSLQTEPCMEKECCPVDGGWTEWDNWQPCSVTCENGIKKRQRTCSNPPPHCGGSCSGEAEETAPCETEVVCPTHGGWSDWGSWGPCGGTCTHEGHDTPKELRKRTCTKPRPSMVPRGRDCDGSDTDSRLCTGLPFCPRDGNWGPWSELTACPVTCGVGRQKQRRTCDSPEPKYGGKQCQGDDQKFGLCTVSVHCPIHGVWTEWGPWGECKPPSKRTIRCRSREGTRRRERDCADRDFEGNFCEGEIVQHGNCYDIEGCEMNAVLSEWSKWSYCKPNCGSKSKQTRERVCIADISAYSSQNIQIFSGIPIIDCKDVPNETQIRACKNVPECP
ncbi:properdin-like isoform X1 [Xyrauchen texanus]|uniref:properdin-like isoform X1 n=1 Tax=Xyrauchen texanus TaxID=154827 RepID=UPI002242A671|nr:properdin-like isoform X1 [Xyrauchen texanus]XP_051950792.1 properdin-like isoform X1 [Xyrauchen texanus]XP_051950793.1 properdin-like isoform X1 [Xyrauchen texanus]